MSDPSTETGADNGAVTAVQDASPANSSNAESEGVKSLIDTVTAVLGEAEASPAADEPGEDVSKQGSADADAKPADPSDDELKQYSPNAQTRIRELVQRRKDAEGALETTKQEIEQYRPKAEQFDRLQGYMREHNISADHLNNSMAITAMVQSGRYEDALRAITPVYQELLKRTGNVLPEDLQQDVEAGYITANRAIELQQARMASANAQTRERQDAERREAEQRQRTAEDKGRMYGESATAWENAKKASDPDWSLKQKLVSDLMEAELRRTRDSDPSKLPSNAREVHAFLDRILIAVEDQIKAFRPKPLPKEHETGRPASAGAKSKPASLMDAVNQALSTG